MKKDRTEAFRIMKYAALLLTVAYIIFLLLFVSGSTRAFEDVEADMARTLDASGLILRDGQEFKSDFGLNQEDYSGVMYYSADSAMSAEEVLIIRVESTEQVEEVLDAVERHAARKLTEFDGYLPDQAALLENAQRSVRGRYIFFAVSAEADTYRKAFEEVI